MQDPRPDAAPDPEAPALAAALPGPAAGLAGLLGRRRARAGGRFAASAALTRPAWALALLCAAPAISVLVTALFGSWELLGLMIQAMLPRYALATLQLAALVGLGAGLIGVGAAVLVTGYAFPGRRLFEVALVAPLAFPAYVLAYAYTYLLDHPGPVQTLLREVMGYGPRDYWFPEIRSLGGAALMLTLVLYPYVYLMTRAALLHQSVTAQHVARTLGLPPRKVLLRVTLPMARPAIVGGLALALMETVADFGTVAHFGVQTFATGIYRAWFSMGDRAAAAQLSVCLLAIALALAAIERAQRGAARRHQAGRRYEALQDVPLTGAAGWTAALFCFLPVLLGFLAPLAMLGSMALRAWGPDMMIERYWSFFANTVILASCGAALTMGAALMIGYAGRLAPGPGARAAQLGASLGYAAPGSVIAVGLLAPLAMLDNQLDAWSRAAFDLPLGLLFTGSIAAILLAYMTRFMAAGLNAVSAGFETAGPNIDASARVLGCSVWGVARRVHAPMLRGSILTGALIVFVDVTKELPATLILRPFDFDTLAVQAHRLASDERLTEAALPSLAIAAVGMAPVLLLARAIRKSRPGAS
ncbi:MAG: iron ABC transporter permease [Rhodobacteraceae bacterium]|nr:iron ABC transporter permease [Paracoccaceae bacterium]MBR28029.1 iron ABC transporter permease [Paracoccaceae bacterium]